MIAFGNSGICPFTSTYHEYVDAETIPEQGRSGLLLLREIHFVGNRGDEETGLAHDNVAHRVREKSRSGYAGRTTRAHAGLYLRKLLRSKETLDFCPIGYHGFKTCSHDGGQDASRSIARLVVQRRRSRLFLLTVIFQKLASITHALDTEGGRDGVVKELEGNTHDGVLQEPSRH